YVVLPSFPTRRSSDLWTPSAKNACSLSSLRFSNGSTAIPVVRGWRTNSLLEAIQAPAATKATREAANSVLVGLRCTHFLLRVKTDRKSTRLNSSHVSI